MCLTAYFYFDCVIFVNSNSLCHSLAAHKKIIFFFFFLVITGKKKKKEEAMPKSLNRFKIVKKTKARMFRRHQSDRVIELKPNWRKPRGIDSRVRRQFRGTIALPSIGYGSNRKTRFLLPNKFYKFVVRNVKDLDMLLMHNQRYCAEIAKTVGAKKRVEILKRAAHLDIKVTNGKAKLVSKEN
jgi:large subunit ribosomal protein L32e